MHVKHNYFFFSLLLLLFSCSEKQVEKQLIAKGEPSYGGEIRFMSPEKVTSLLPHANNDIYSFRIMNQLFNRLLAIDSDSLTVIPALAKKYFVSEDGKKYTFKLEENVFFHDNPCFPSGEGKKMTAKDVLFSLEFACSGLNENTVSSLLINHIVGAKQFNEKTKHKLSSSKLSGVKVIDDYTIEIRLNEAFVNFDKILTHPSLVIFPEEAWIRYQKQVFKNPVGTGAFQLESWSSDSICLKRNPHFWKKDAYGNTLPYLDRVVMYYSATKKEELLAFRNQEIDLVIEIPSEKIDYVLGSLKDAQAGKNIKHKVDSKPSLSTNYLAFNLSKAPFDDLRVRKAFNLAIDRKNLVEQWLKGEGFPMNHGFVPDMPNYSSEKVLGFTQDVDLAQRLLKEAGYPNGAGFPSIEIYVNTKEGTESYELAKGVVVQLKNNLNVDLKIKICSLSEQNEAIHSNKALLWRSKWIADYPDPSNFLNLFYSKNVRNDGAFSNLNQFKNEQFNKLFEASWNEKSVEKRLKLFQECDQIIIDEAAIIPLTNDDFFILIQSKYKNFSLSSMEWMDFSRIFIKEPRR